MVHGCIDGYSRRVMYLLISTNNRATTVAEAFQASVERYGLPSRVRSDKEASYGTGSNEVSIVGLKSAKLASYTANARD